MLDYAILNVKEVIKKVDNLYCRYGSMVDDCKDMIKACILAIVAFGVFEIPALLWVIMKPFNLALLEWCIGLGALILLSFVFLLIVSLVKKRLLVNVVCDINMLSHSLEILLNSHDGRDLGAIKDTIVIWPKC